LPHGAGFAFGTYPSKASKAVRGIPPASLSPPLLPGGRGAAGATRRGGGLFPGAPGGDGFLLTNQARSASEARLGRKRPCGTKKGDRGRGVRADRGRFPFFFEEQGEGGRGGRPWFSTP